MLILKGFWLFYLSYIEIMPRLLNHSDKDELLYMDDRIIEDEEKKESERSKFTLTRNIDLSNQIATLFSLGFIK